MCSSVDDWFLHVEIFSPCSYLWWSDLCYLLQMFECCICLHIMVMIICLIDSFVSYVVYLCICALSPFCCTCYFVLLCIVGSLVGSAPSSVCVYILKFCLHWIMLTFILYGIVVWFFTVGLLSCRCLVDLPGVKTLLLTNQQHQLLKGSTIISGISRSQWG